MRTTEGVTESLARNSERTRQFKGADIFRFRYPKCEPIMSRESNSPATLVAIIVAARRAGNRELERTMRRQLAQRFRVKLRFARESSHSVENGGEDAT